MKKLLFSLFFILGFTAVAQASKTETPASIPGTTTISAEDVISLLDKHANLVIVDARIDKDRKGGHIEGSVSLPDVDTTETSLAKVVPNKATPVLFYCNGVKCGRSVKSAKNAVQWGYKTIYWFRGGWEEWTDKGMPISK